jgi:hypothetical protein
MVASTTPPAANPTHATKEVRVKRRNTLTRRGRRAALVRLAAAIAVVAVSLPIATSVASTAGPAAGTPVSVAPVTGEGVHWFTTAIVHSQEETQTGMIQRSSDVVQLSGDLVGFLLYHPTSTFDFANGTLTNTGTQLFSGTVLGSEPVLLHDDRFRFEVDLETGATTGEVHLGRSRDAAHEGHWYECSLNVVGTGMTPAGDATFTYDGECTRFELR